MPRRAAAAAVRGRGRGERSEREKTRIGRKISEIPGEPRDDSISRRPLNGPGMKRAFLPLFLKAGHSSAEAEALVYALLLPPSAAPACPRSPTRASPRRRAELFERRVDFARSEPRVEASFCRRAPYTHPLISFGFLRLLINALGTRN